MTIELNSSARVTIPAGPTGSADAIAGEPLDLVFIEGLQAATIIGIYDDELTAPQPVRIDLTAGVPRLLACRTDRIEDTLNYAGMRAAILALLESHRLQLLEALAETIAQLVLNDFGAHWVRVAVAKPRKFDDVDRVGVVIERRRASTPATAQRVRGGDAVLSLIGTASSPPHRS